MLQIVIALSAASPIVLQHRLVLRVRFWIGTVFWLALAFIVAALVYFALLMALVEIYPLGQPLSSLIYGASFALATLLSVIAGTVVSPKRLFRIIIPGGRMLAMMFPFSLYFYFGMAGAWRATYLIYLIGSVVGGYGVEWLTSQARRSTFVTL